MTLFRTVRLNLAVALWLLRTEVSRDLDRLRHDRPGDDGQFTEVQRELDELRTLIGSVRRHNRRHGDTVPIDLAALVEYHESVNGSRG